MVVTTRIWVRREGTENVRRDWVVRYEGYLEPTPGEGLGDGHPTSAKSNIPRVLYSG